MARRQAPSRAARDGCVEMSASAWSISGDAAAAAAAAALEAIAGAQLASFCPFQGQLLIRVEQEYRTHLVMGVTVRMTQARPCALHLCSVFRSRPVVCVLCSLFAVRIPSVRRGVLDLAVTRCSQNEHIRMLVGLAEREHCLARI